MAFEWIKGGNDRQLAATTYKGAESASARKTRVENATADRKASAARTSTRKSRSRSATEAARAGQAWEDKDRARERRRFW